MTEHNDEALQLFTESLINGLGDGTPPAEHEATEFYLLLFRELGNGASIKPKVGLMESVTKEIADEADHKAELRYRTAVALILVTFATLIFLAMQLVNSVYVNNLFGFLKEREGPVIFAIGVLILIQFGGRLFKSYYVRYFGT